MKIGTRALRPVNYRKRLGDLACIDHKSSAAVATVTLNSIRICAECRLWQRNSPAGAGNHLRSSSYGVSANRVRSRHSEATAEFRCSQREEFKNSLFGFIYSKKRLLNGRAASV